MAKIVVPWSAGPAGSLDIPLIQGTFSTLEAGDYLIEIYVDS